MAASAFKFARQAFATEKPHTSITSYVDILTGSSYQEESYDGIPELVDSINIQPATGPGEASRAIRKKLKHGNTHQQYRALVILKALVENCGDKFHDTFRDHQLTDALKHLAHDSNTDRRVQKKLLLVLASWKEQFKDDPSMRIVVTLYQQCKPARPVQRDELAHMMGLTPSEEDQKRKKEKEARKKAKEEAREKKAKKRMEEDAQRKKPAQRAPFSYDKEKPKVLQSIVEGSQASSNLVNAITLVNTATDSLQTNENVQKCLEVAKKVRKPVVRYIQLVESEEVIGTLIETNDRLMSALEMYERLSTSDVDPDPESTELTKAMAKTQIAAPPGEVLPSPFADSASESEPYSPTTGSHIHPDLEDLSFGGTLGQASNGLQAPLKPARRSNEAVRSEGEGEGDRRGSLSDFSDYDDSDSSDEETHNRRGGPSSGPKHKPYVRASDDDLDPVRPLASQAQKSADPFADPFA